MLVEHLVDYMKCHPVRGFARLSDYTHQEIMSYLEVEDLLKVGAVSKQTHTWLEQNCNKSLMRKAHQQRRMITTTRHRTFEG